MCISQLFSIRTDQPEAYLCFVNSVAAILERIYNIKQRNKYFNLSLYMYNIVGDVARRTLATIFIKYIQNKSYFHFSSSVLKFWAFFSLMFL